MTTIVGMVDGNKIRMASDSRIVEPNSGRFWDSISMPKIAVRGNLVIGVAGDKHIIDHIIHRWDPIGLDLTGNPVVVAATVVQPSLAAHCEDLEGEWRALVGFGGMLFDVTEMDATHDANHDYAAVGSGATIALGSLYSSDENLETRPRLRIALLAASRFDCNTGGLFQQVTLEC